MVILKTKDYNELVKSLDSAEKGLKKTKQLLSDYKSEIDDLFREIEDVIVDKSLFSNDKVTEIKKLVNTYTEHID